jgi:ankyrin repeat protein
MEHSVMKKQEQMAGKIEDETDSTTPVPLDEFICPITQDTFVDPVVASDGHTYEKAAIQRHIETSGPFSPITREHISRNLIPNRHIQGIIEQRCSSNRQRLVAAIKSKNRELAKQYLTSHKQLLSCELENGYTAWHLACEYGTSFMVEDLLDILQEDTHSLKCLLEVAPPIKFSPSNANCMLEILLRNRSLKDEHTEKASLLIKLGADLEQPDTTNNTLLHRLVIHRHNLCASVRWLVNSHSVNLEKPNNQGNTALLLAIECGSMLMVAELINLGAKINVQNNLQYSPIALALLKEKQSILNLLITEEQQQLSPLHLAVELDDVVLFKILLDKKHDIDSQDPNGNTLLHLAAGLGNHQMIRLLLAANADYKIKNNKRETPSRLAENKSDFATADLIRHTMQQKIIDLNNQIACLENKVAQLENIIIPTIATATSPIIYQYSHSRMQQTRPEVISTETDCHNSTNLTATPIGDF